jgi:hypothetical protein
LRTHRKERTTIEIKDGHAYIYNNPIPDKATSVSIVLVSGLDYYRNEFYLRKVWETPNG